jgi:hypothetical protein
LRRRQRALGALNQSLLDAGISVIRLKFRALQDAHSVTVGPAESFRVAGNFLRQMPENKILGNYVRHQWHLQDRHFSRYDCLDECWVHFADAEGAATGSFGPFREFHVADGTAYTGEKLFAKFIDETLLWHSFDLESYWPNMIIATQPSGC